MRLTNLQWCPYVPKHREGKLGCHELFRHYEARARSSGKGLWSESSTTAVSAVVSKVESESASDADVDGDTTVYVTKSGSKYHREGCR